MYALIVDDGRMDSIISRAMLSSVGFHVTIASGGAEALRLIKMVEFDLVLMDYQMPEMNGAQVAEKIRELENERHAKNPCKIIVVSGENPETTYAAFAKGQVVDFIEKPISIGSLVKVLGPHFKLTHAGS